MRWAAFLAPASGSPTRVWSLTFSPLVQRESNALLCGPHRSLPSPLEEGGGHDVVTESGHHVHDAGDGPDLRLDELKDLAEHDDLTAFVRRAYHVHPSDLADVLAALEEPARVRVIAELPTEIASSALAEM